MFTGPNIITDGLVLYLDAANTKSYPQTGTVWKDLSGNGNNGTLVNGPTFDSGSNGSIVFDGVNDYVSIPNIFTSGPNSVCAWVYNTNLSVDTTVIGLWGGQYLLYMDTGGGGDGYRVLYVLSGTPKATSTSNANAIENQWQNVVSTFSGTELSLYVDGNHIQTVSFSFNTMDTSANNLTIGADSTNLNRAWNGKINNVIIYNQALTPEEILQNYNATKSRYGL
jgi:hypothetical protein